MTAFKGLAGSSSPKALPWIFSKLPTLPNEAPPKAIVGASLKVSRVIMRRNIAREAGVCKPAVVDKSVGLVVRWQTIAFVRPRSLCDDPARLASRGSLGRAETVRTRDQ